MSDRLELSNIRFVSAPAGLVATGLLGWVTLTLNGELDLGYIGVRRTRDGRLVLAFPERRDGAGISHPIVRPLDQAARDEITAQVVAELRRMRVLA